MLFANPYRSPAGQSSGWRHFLERGPFGSRGEPCRSNPGLERPHFINSDNFFRNDEDAFLLRVIRKGERAKCEKPGTGALHRIMDRCLGTECYPPGLCVLEAFRTGKLRPDDFACSKESSSSPLENQKIFIFPMWKERCVFSRLSRCSEHGQRIHIPALYHHLTRLPL